MNPTEVIAALGLDSTSALGRRPAISNSRGRSQTTATETSLERERYHGPRGDYVRGGGERQEMARRRLALAQLVDDGLDHRSG